METLIYLGFFLAGIITISPIAYRLGQMKVLGIKFGRKSKALERGY